MARLIDSAFSCAGNPEWGRTAFLFGASVLVVYWLQPSLPIRGLDYWLPTLTLGIDGNLLGSRHPAGRTLAARQCPCPARAAGRGAVGGAFPADQPASRHPDTGPSPAGPVRHWTGYSGDSHCIYLYAITSGLPSV